MVWTSYKEQIKEISEQIIKVQKPIRIMDAIKHDPSLFELFKKSKYKSIPKIPKDYYSPKDLDYSIHQKTKEFRAIKQNISKVFGRDNDLGNLLNEIVEEYILVLDLIKNRGKNKFYQISKHLYGSPQEPFLSDHNTIFELGRLLYSMLSGIKNTMDMPSGEKELAPEEVVQRLNQKLNPYFHSDEVLAVVSDGIVADATAGGDKIKINGNRMFSPRQVDIYEVHEGWVHVGTTLNGRNQPVAKWLSVGPPRVASTQEGLAVLMEIFTFRTSVRRTQRINDRIIGIHKIEQGANLIDIFEYFRTEGYPEQECLDNAFRLFRGCHLNGGAAFTKDISYCRGFVENFNFMRSAIRANKPFLLPFLFAGKTHVKDIPLIYHLYQEGIVEFPKYLPPHFQDINGIAVWMSFSTFFNKVDVRRVQSHFNKLFNQDFSIRPRI